MKQPTKKLAPKLQYISPSQLTIEGFEAPFDQVLDKNNRWVRLSHLIPWDTICPIYQRHFSSSRTGRKPVNPRIALGAIIIKHICNLDDRETIAQISENVYMQYFLGYPSFSSHPPFDASLFVEIRKRLGLEAINEINEKIVLLMNQDNSQSSDASESEDSAQGEEGGSSNKGRVLFDATACPQDIAYPTDLNLLSEAREKSEELIDKIYNLALHQTKPRTYRQIARKKCLEVAQMKNKPKKKLERAIKGQLGYLGRNLASLHRLLDSYPVIPFDKKDYKYFLVLQTLYSQQDYMYRNRTHVIEDRIVSIHQPHVRPIVRGKAQAKVEFGSKIHLSYCNGISFLDELSWDAFNEGSHMMQYIELYRRRYGYYPAEVLADKIYCTRQNRQNLKLLGIKLVAKPLGRPSAVADHVRPGERNPVEGKFGQAKTAYGLNRIRARLKDTSQSWIASTILVLNLIKLIGWTPFCPNLSFNIRTIVHQLLKIIMPQNFDKDDVFAFYPILSNSQSGCVIQQTLFI